MVMAMMYNDPTLHIILVHLWHSPMKYIPLRVLALTKRHVGSGNEIGRRTHTPSTYISRIGLIGSIIFPVGTAMNVTLKHFTRGKFIPVLVFLL